MKRLLVTTKEPQIPHWLIAGGLLIIIGVAELVGVLQPLRRFGEQITQPFLRTSSAVVYSTLFPYRMITNAHQSYSRIQDLELRYSEVLAQLGELQSLRAENEELRKVLGVAPSDIRHKRMITTIIGYGQPLIEKHAQDFISEGNMVLIAQTLIGRIGKVSEGQAEVQLLLHPLSQSILAKTESGISGIVAGNGRQVLLKEVPIEAELKVGEQVTTLGQLGIQSDVFIGKIQSLHREDGSPTQTAILDQGVSFYESRVVEVRQ